MWTESWSDGLWTENPTTQCSVQLDVEAQAVLHCVPMDSGRAYLIARLALADPEQHRAFQSGEKTLYRALVDAGIRTRRVSVEIDRIDSVARVLLRHLSDEQRSELVKLLKVS